MVLMILSSISTLPDALAMVMMKPGTNSCYNLCFICFSKAGRMSFLAVAGPPYDTLEEVIGKRDSHGMGSLIDFGVKYREVPTQNPNCLVMVDNCYGEFVESIEPPMVAIKCQAGVQGADLIAGSLIKNPGGTIAPCGGYVAGKENG
ncbi:hypothetical protein GBA52_013922 [Prunus armeniaca]|nr:hypothetical protein GBA52_013922 [Prunus armeniaca]